MSPPQRGNPYLQVRLAPEIVEKMKVEIGGGDGGKAGGVSLFVRRLIYRELREPLPKQWGHPDQAMADLFALADEAEAWLELDRKEQSRRWTVALKIMGSAEAIILTETKDIVRRNFAAQIVGLMAAPLLRERQLGWSGWPPDEYETAPEDKDYRPESGALRAQAKKKS